MNAGEQPRRRVELDGGIYATVGYEGGHPDRLALYWDGGEFIAAADLSKRARAELAVALMGLPEVVEVGSGHDEQTEEHIAKLEGNLKIAYDMVETLTDQVRDERERTVAAVVKELQEVADEMAAEYAPSHASGVIQAKRRIEERFGSSVSGGD